MAEEAAVDSVREGSAEVLSPYAAAVADAAAAGAERPQRQKQDVFYNPAQVFNRDFSVLVLNVYSKIRQLEDEAKAREREEKLRKRQQQDPSAAPEAAAAEGSGSAAAKPYQGLRILEALAASGLRSVRYWNEVENVHTIVCNDLDPTAVKHMRRNMAHNNIPEAQEEDVAGTSNIAGNGGSSSSGAGAGTSRGGVKPTQGDAILHMYAHVGEYDVIDLDPYGTASPFLDAALKSVKSGGLLCVTSTDMPILGGNHPETCFYRYGGTALKAKYVHEMSLRLLMNAIQSTAARHQRYVEPLISISIDFYVRVFVRVYDGASNAKALGACTGLVFQCTQCDSFHVQPLGDIDEQDKKKKGKQKDKGSQYPFASTTDGSTQPEVASGQGATSLPVCEGPRAAYVAIPSNRFCFSGSMTSALMRAAMHRLAGIQAEAAAADNAGEPSGAEGATAGSEEVAAGADATQKGQPPRYRVARAREEINGHCNECGGRYVIGGPFYLGSLYNKEFIRLCLHVCELEALEHVVSWKKITGLLTAMEEEIESIPLHYDLPNICSSLKLQTIPLKQFRGILRSLGYQVSHFHREPNAIKTDAPSSAMYDILRRWAEHSGARQKKGDEEKDRNTNKKRGSPASHIEVILGKSEQAGSPEWATRLKAIDFDKTSYAAHDESEERPRKVARFLPNPEKNWGPKPRAKPVRET